MEKRYACRVQLARYYVAGESTRAEASYENNFLRGTPKEREESNEKGRERIREIRR